MNTYARVYARAYTCIHGRGSEENYRRGEARRGEARKRKPETPAGLPSRIFLSVYPILLSLPLSSFFLSCLLSRSFSSLRSFDRSSRSVRSRLPHLVILPLALRFPRARTLLGLDGPNDIHALAVRSRSPRTFLDWTTQQTLFRVPVKLLRGSRTVRCRKPLPLINFCVPWTRIPILSLLCSDSAR